MICHTWTKHSMVRMRLKRCLNSKQKEKMNSFVSETLRINPPSGISSKVCTSATELTDYEGNTVPIEKGMIVQIPIYCFHHDERVYSDPETFDPDRFSPENGGIKAYKDKGAFIPFLDGPRQCLGKLYLVRPHRFENWQWKWILFLQRNEICIGPVQGSCSWDS